MDASQCNLMEFVWAAQGTVKIRKFQNESMKSLHCPKYEHKFEKFCPEYLGQNFSKFFVQILGNVMTSYFHFEIYWPLSTYVPSRSMVHICKCKLIFGTLHYSFFTNFRQNDVINTYLVFVGVFIQTRSTHAGLSHARGGGMCPPPPRVLQIS